MPQTIRLDIASGVARVTLDRPDQLNAFADDMREQLIAALDRVAATPGVNVLVVVPHNGKSAATIVESAHKMGVPVIEIDGRAIVGFDQAQIEGEIDGGDGDAEGDKQQGVGGPPGPGE